MMRACSITAVHARYEVCTTVPDTVRDGPTHVIIMPMMARCVITPDEPGGSRADMSRGAEEGLQLPWVMSAHHGSTGVVPTVVCGAETMMRPISSRGQPLQQWLDGII